MIMDMADAPKEKQKIEQIYLEYHKLLYIVAFRILNNREDAEDVELEVWEKVIKNLDKIDEHDKVRTKNYLIIITEHTAIDYYRKKKKRKIHECSIEQYDEQSFFINKDATFEDSELYMVLHNMKKRYSEVLLLYYVNEMTTDEIAKMLNVKDATVRKRLERAREQLRKELEG